MNNFLLKFCRVGILSFFLISIQILVFEPSVSLVSQLSMGFIREVFIQIQPSETK